MTLPPPALSATENQPDPDLTDLPSPRRPLRRVTLGVLTLVAVASLGVLWGLRGEIGYCLSFSPVQPLGDLAQLHPSAALANHWVQGRAPLAAEGAVRFQRPLESDSYRMGPVAGNPQLWIQFRVPAVYDNEAFIPPASFVGRLMPLNRTALRQAALAGAVVEAGWPKGHLPANAWLLVDGESPASTRWALGLAGLLVGCALFAVWGLWSLLRPLPPLRREC